MTKTDLKNELADVLIDSDQRFGDLYLTMRAIAASLRLITDSWDDNGNFGNGPEGNWDAYNDLQLVNAHMRNTIARVEGGL